MVSGSGFFLKWKNGCRNESQEYESKEMCRCAQECMEEQSVSMVIKRGMYKGIVAPTAHCMTVRLGYWKIRLRIE